MNSINSYPVRCGLAVLSGAVYAMAYPPLGWGWLVVPGLIGLMLALRGQSGTRARAIGFLHGMTAYGLSVSWLLHVFGGMAVVLWCVLAAFTALFAEMQGRAGLRGVSGWKLAIFTASGSFSKGSGQRGNITIARTKAPSPVAADFHFLMNSNVAESTTSVPTP